VAPGELTSTSSLTALNCGVAGLLISIGAVAWLSNHRRIPLPKLRPVPKLVPRRRLIWWHKAIFVALVAFIATLVVERYQAWLGTPSGQRKDNVPDAVVAAPPKVPAPVPAKKPSQTATVTPAPSPSRCESTEAPVDNEMRCLKPKDSFKDCPDCPEMVVVPAGSFTVGSPHREPERSNDEAQVRVSIAEPFAVGKYALTFDEWDACLADGGCNGYKPNDQGWGRGKQPVINVNWDDAKAYTVWLSRKTGKTYRLLSEAEREYATRAGTTTPFWWGSSINPKQANYDGNYTYDGSGSKSGYRRRTVSVDSFEPNPWGLYNVHGNVWEWAEDCWNESNSGNPGDGSARTTGDCARRVVHGGSWFDDPKHLRSAGRTGRTSGFQGVNQGFRLARTLDPTVPKRSAPHATIEAKQPALPSVTAVKLPTAPPTLSPDCRTKRVAGDLFRLPLRALSRAVRAKRQVRVLAIGSSSTAGVGASSSSATYIAKLETSLEGSLQGMDFDVVGRGLSGEVAQGAADRMKHEVEETKPDLVVWELGTNDALRHVSLDKFKACVKTTLAWLAENKIDVVLIDPQYGKALTTDTYYEQMVGAVAEVAREARVLLVARFEAMRELQHERGDLFYLSSDQLHPNDRGHRCMAEQLARTIVGGLMQADAEQTQPALANRPIEALQPEEKVPEGFDLESARLLLAGSRAYFRSVARWETSLQGKQFWRNEEMRLISGAGLSPEAKKAIETWIAVRSKATVERAEELATQASERFTAVLSRRRALIRLLCWRRYRAGSHPLPAGCAIASGQYERRP
jgi:formylglycine-generating enzyme required for sulfatase activity/lysophospholipase L1-like esterase